MALYWLGYAIEQRRDVKCVCRATSMASSGSVCVCSVLETLLTEQVLRTFYVLFFFFLFWLCWFLPVVKRELHWEVTL